MRPARVPHSLTHLSLSLATTRLPFHTLFRPPFSSTFSLQTHTHTTAPARTDGHDLSAAFRSRDPAEKGPRRSVLMQHDVFMNTTAYRSGCHKLVLGCPGGRALYLEPDHRLLRPLHEGA